MKKLLIAILLLVPTLSFAATPQRACMAKNGRIFIRAKCLKGETVFGAGTVKSLSVVQQGPQGSQGAVGPQGPAGTPAEDLFVFDSTGKKVGLVSSVGCSALFPLRETTVVESAIVIVKFNDEHYPICIKREKFASYDEILFDGLGCNGQAYINPHSLNANSLFKQAIIELKDTKQILHKVDFESGEILVEKIQSYRNDQGGCSEANTSGYFYKINEVANLTDTFVAPYTVK